MSHGTALRGRNSACARKLGESHSDAASEVFLRQSDHVLHSSGSHQRLNELPDLRHMLEHFANREHPVRRFPRQRPRQVLVEVIDFAQEEIVPVAEVSVERRSSDLCAIEYVLNRDSVEVLFLNERHDRAAQLIASATYSTIHFSVLGCTVSGHSTPACSISQLLREIAADSEAIVTYSAPMTDNQKGGIALIAGAIGGLVTMAIHPTGSGILTPAQYQRFVMLNVGAHSLAIASMPIAFLGALALTRRLQSPDRFSTSAIVVYGFALIAGMLAATASGFIVTPLVGTAASPANELNQALSHYTRLWNQAFARSLSVGTSVAILLW